MVSTGCPGYREDMDNYVAVVCDTDNAVVTNSDTTGRADTLSAKAAKISTVAVAVLAGAVVCAVVLVRAQVVVLALLGAIVIAEAIRPLVDGVTSRAPRGAAIGLVFAAVFLALIVVWLIPLQALLPQALALWATIPALIAEYAPRLPASAPSVLLNVLVSGERDFAQNLSMVGLAVVMALFWFGASSKLRATALSFAQGQRRTTLDSLFSELGNRLRLYVVGALINGAIVGVICALGLAWMRFLFRSRSACWRGFWSRFPTSVRLSVCFSPAPSLLRCRVCWAPAKRSRWFRSPTRSKERLLRR
jgi:predicted PurR-regulated permease PerM